MHLFDDRVDCIEDGRMQTVIWSHHQRVAPVNGKHKLGEIIGPA